MENKVYYLIDKGIFKKSNHYLNVLDPNYVRVEFLYCGICGGDYSCFCGRRTSYPYTLGHEFVAKVIDVGLNVQEFTKDDLVISDFNFRCGKCEYCRTGQEHLCIHNNKEYFSNRAFAKYGDIHYNYLYKVKPLNKIMHATLIEPLSCVIHAYEKVKQLGQLKNILIVGLGNIGMLFAFYLKRVIGIDKVYVHDIILQKKQRIIDLFRCNSFNIDNNLRYDLIIDATNTISGARFCLDLSKSSQKYCMMSHLYGLETSFIYEMFCKKEIIPLFPLRNGNSGNMLKSMQIIAQYWNSEYEQTMEIFPISEIQKVFEKKPTLTSNKQIFSISDFLN